MYNYYYKRILKMSVKEILLKIIKWIKLRVSYFILWLLDIALGSYLGLDIIRVESISRFVLIKDMNLSEERVNIIKELSNFFCSHSFDLLGSGWTQVKFGMSYKGLEGCKYNEDSKTLGCFRGWPIGRINKSNIRESTRIRNMISADYMPIDWNVDFISGYRWDNDVWYKNIKYGHVVGADVKIPIELSRMQHLPQLAFAYYYALSDGTGFKHSDIYKEEFCNQVLDFFSANPPRFGCNWYYSMDVGIRAANILLTYDSFTNFGATFNHDFNKVLFRSIYEHGLHIYRNLEYSPTMRGNHYLANLVGLLFVVAYLPKTNITDKWLLFSVSELVNEIDFQFNDDGTNFEASTSYHCLATQIYAFGTALVLGLSEGKKEFLNKHLYESVNNKRYLTKTIENHNNPTCSCPFSKLYFNKLYKMALFIKDMTKQNGQISQIGDNDSGRLFKISMKYDRTTVEAVKLKYKNLECYDALPNKNLYFDANDLDYGDVVSAVNGLFNSSYLSDLKGNNSFDFYLIQTISKGFYYNFDFIKNDSLELNNAIQKGKKYLSLIDNAKTLDSKEQAHLNVMEISLPFNINHNNISLKAYPAFGIYIYKGNGFYLAIRCGSIGQHALRGHAHNDQLSVELNIEGIDWIVDPGSYVYTPLKKRRNEYRSVKSHFAPCLDNVEPASLSNGLFYLGDDPNAKCLYFGDTCFIGVHYGYEFPLYRIIELKREKITITDFFDVCKESSFQNKRIFVNQNIVNQTVGYGKVLKRSSIDTDRAGLFLKLSS